MAENVKINIVADDGGSTKKLIKDANQLKAAYDSAGESAGKINASGTRGSRAAASRAKPVGENMSGQQYGQVRGSTGPADDNMSGQQYGQMRGSARLTGASSRDFANQAQGLGGLVRLYATYAANIFAVSAAFSALKGAADTTNLVKGLDTLGATSGRSLGQLSKQLVSATDGAISLREAMTSVAMTSSAGMSGENIRRLAGVAKNASLALGVSMPDALSRLSRGIVKLEPELLDELGLFTKIGPATEKYALEVGKTASQLTDFERRQAFANAVLAEGEQKFKSLAESSANPYDKLLASLKNVTSSGLDLVNKVLSPIVNLLAQSPTALASGLLAIGGLLLKQALPALGEFKQGLKMAADRDLQAAKNRAGDAVQARTQLNKLIEAKVEASADIELNKFEELEGKLYSVRESGIRKRGALYKVLEKDIVDISDKEVLAAEKSVKKLEQRAASDDKLKPIASLERATLDQLKAVISAEEGLTALRLKNRDLVNQELESSGVLAKINKQVLDYERDAKKSALVSNAAYNSSLLGIVSSWKLFRLEVEASALKLGFVEKGILLIKGAAASLTGVITALGGALNRAFAIFTVLATIFSVLDAVLSTNSKQMQKFGSSIDAANDSVSNAKRTVEAFKDVSGVEKSTIETTLALSNAFTEIADSAKAASKGAAEAKASASGFDTAWNWLLGFANLDIDSKLSKAISSQIMSAFELLKRENLGAEFETAVKGILGVKNITLNELEAAYKSATASQRTAIDALMQKNKAAVGQTSLELQNFKETSDSASKAYKEFLQSTYDTNPLFKMGEAFVQVAISMEEIADKSGSITKAFDHLLANPDKASIFGKEFVEGFSKIKKEFEKQTLVVSIYNNRIRELQDTISNLESISGVSGYDSPDLLKARSDLQGLKEATLKLDTSAIKTANELFTKGITQALAKGLELAQRGLTEAYQAAGSAIAKASTGALSGERRIQEEAAIQKEQLASQLNIVNSNIELADVQAQLVAEMRLANALEQQKSSTKRDPDTLSKLQQEVNFAKAGTEIAKGILPAIEGLTKEQQSQLNAQQQLQNIRNIQQKAQQVRLGGETNALDISTNIASRRATLQEEAELSNLVAGITKQYSDRLGLLQTIAGVTSDEVIKQQNAIELSQLENKQKLENSKLQLDINLAQERANASTGESKKRYENEVAILKVKQNLLNASNALELDNRAIQARQKLLQEEIAQIGRKAELEKQSRDTAFALAQAQQEIAQAQLTSAAELYSYSEGYVRNEQYALDLAKARTENEKARSEILGSYAIKEAEAQARSKALTASGLGPDSQQQKAVVDDLIRQKELRDGALLQADAQLNKSVAILDITKQTADQQQRYNDILKASTDFATSLKDAFGSLGESLGGLVTSITSFAVNAEKAAATQEDLTESIKDARKTGERTGDFTKFNKLVEEQGKLTKKNTKDEINGYANMAKAAKKLFSEKTTAYKTLDGLEKINSAKSIALSVKEFAIKSGLLKQEQIDELAASAKSLALKASDTLKSIGIDIPAIYAKFMALLGPFGPPAAAAAIAAFVGGVFGGGGGGSAFVPSAEQRQETQGTAMSYDASGNLVQTRRGVFGDTEAKSESIANSLELIKETSVAGLDYDNRMVSLLESIDQGINNTAKGLYRIQGLRTGSMFGTVEGTQSGGGGGLTTLSLGLLGSKTSRTITDSGLIIQGTFAQLASDTNKAVIDFFEQVTVTKKSWYGKTKTWVETYRAEIDDATSEFFQGVFGDATRLFLEVGDLAGVSADTITQILSTFDLTTQFASLRGLKGEDFEKELSSIIGAILDDASLAIFSNFEQFAEFGEGMLETVIRVVDTNTKINQLITNLGINTPDLSKLYGITEALAAAAGGLEDFISQANYFSENFLTEAERVVPTQKAVIKQLTALGYASVDTKAEFKSLVQSLDLTTASGQQTYQSLMDLAPGFVEVFDVLEDQASTIQDTIDRFKDFSASIMEFKNSLLLGSASVLTPEQKYVEARTQFEETYSKALTGDKDAMSRVTSSAQSFLEASKTYFASSESYTIDFNTVLSKLDYADISAKASADVAQLQLDNLSIHTDLLTSINENIALIAGVPARAGGGRASGLTLVGEMGPELVDFSTPGRVYTADQTAGMFAPATNNNVQQALIREIQNLRQEVAQLREQQSTETGHLINATYDAQNRNATQVADGVKEAVAKQAWADTVRQNAVIK